MTTRAERIAIERGAEIARLRAALKAIQAKVRMSRLERSEGARLLDIDRLVIDALATPDAGEVAP